MTVKDAWKIVKQSIVNFFANNTLKLSASLAFFTILALPGLLIIIIWFTDMFYGREAIEGSIYNQIEKFVGHSAALDIQQTIQNTSLSSSSHFATIVGTITLIIAATSVFGEIQDSINKIWRLKARPRKGFGILKMIFDRLLSFSIIITLAFILLVSLIINGAMELLMNKLMEQYPQVTVIVIYVLNMILTYFITTLIFAAIFKVLPDARIKWKHVWKGALVTALLFMSGRFLISYSLGHSRMTSVYGTAGYVIVVLLWVYYSSMILYFGATFTQAYVKYKGANIYPNNYAVWVKQIEIESEASIQQQPDVEKKVMEAPSYKEKPSG